MWCCITPERVEKSKRVMDALARGWPGGKVCIGRPPDDGEGFIVWGQKWLAEEIIPPALKSGRPFFQIDNGFHRPARGDPDGFYRFMYRQPGPVFLADENLRRSRALPSDVACAPWRSKGDHIVVAMPGRERGGFGSAFGIDLDTWCANILPRLKAVTARRIRVRPRNADYPLALDLKNAWALVTHSSNVATDAVLAGIPVFVEPSSMCVPVGNLDLNRIEDPKMPERSAWWASLMCQQFSVPEMADGTAFQFLRAVAAQTDQMKGVSNGLL